VAAKRKKTTKKATKRKATKKKTTARKATKRAATKARKKTTTRRKAAAKRKTAARKRPATRRKATSKRGTRNKATKKAASRKKSTAKRKSTTAKRKAVAKAPKQVEKKPTGPVFPKKPVLAQPKNSGTKQFTQSELFDCMCSYIGFESRRQARDFYAQFSDMIQKSLKSGYKIVLPGLGKIQVKRTKARMGRNPMTGEPIRIPAKKKVAFSANKALKDAVL